MNNSYGVLMWLLEKTIKHPQNDIKLRNVLNSLNIDFIEIIKNHLSL